jgi:hypothetical protein
MQGIRSRQLWILIRCSGKIRPRKIRPSSRPSELYSIQSYQFWFSAMEKILLIN